MSLGREDRIILSELQRDCEQSLSQLSEKTGMRPSTMHRRILMLKKKGVIERCKAIVSDDKTGIKVVAFMLVSGKTGFKLGNDIIRDPHVVEIWGITGTYDVLIKSRFYTTEEFSDFLLQFRQKYGESVNRTETLISTVKIKETTEKPIQS